MSQSITDRGVIEIQMLKTVTPDALPGVYRRDPSYVLEMGEIYYARSNKNGAISGICSNGRLLGVKPGEFRFLRAPAWVVDLWRKYGEDVGNVEIVDAQEA